MQQANELRRIRLRPLAGEYVIQRRSASPIGSALRFPNQDSITFMVPTVYPNTSAETLLIRPSHGLSASEAMHKQRVRHRVMT